MWTTNKLLFIFLEEYKHLSPIEQNIQHSIH